MSTITAKDILRVIGAAQQRHTGARIGFCAQHLGTGQVVEWESAQKLEAASVIKVFLVYQFLCEKWELRDKKFVINTSQREAAVGAGIIKLLSTPELTLTYRDLLALTLSISDNFATSLVLEAVGGISSFNRFVATLPGIASTAWASELTPQLFSSGNLAFTSAADLVKFAALLFSRNGPAEREFLRLFALESEFHVDRLGRRLPLEGFIDGQSPIAYYGSKGGTFSRLGVTNDFAVVELRSGQRFAAAILCQGFYSQDGFRNAHIDHPASQLIAEVGAMIGSLWV